MNAFDQVRDAVAQARQLQCAAAANAQPMAELLVGNLRRVGHSELRKLKTELKAYNPHTRSWRDAK